MVFPLEWSRSVMRRGGCGPPGRGCTAPQPASRAEASSATSSTGRTILVTDMDPPRFPERLLDGVGASAVPPRNGQVAHPADRALGLVFLTAALICQFDHQHAHRPVT